MKSELLNKLIYQNYSSQVYQPVSSPGLFYAFRNNCIHSGGNTIKGYERYVCVFHIYPHHQEVDKKSYFKKGIKNEFYPKNPFLLEY